jgi:hypothetical protein
MPSAYGIVILRTRSSERRRSLGKVGRVVSVRRSIATRYVHQPRSAYTYMTVIASYGLSISLSAKACTRMLKRYGQKRKLNGCGQPENKGGWELSFSCWHRPMTPSPPHRPGDTNKTTIVVGWIIQHQWTFTQCSRTNAVCGDWVAAAVATAAEMCGAFSFVLRRPFAASLWQPCCPSRWQWNWRAALSAMGLVLKQWRCWMARAMLSSWIDGCSVETRKDLSSYWRQSQLWQEPLVSHSIPTILGSCCCVRGWTCC